VRGVKRTGVTPFHFAVGSKPCVLEQAMILEKIEGKEFDD
jgi:hypothetical protein